MVSTTDSDLCLPQDFPQPFPQTATRGKHKIANQPFLGGGGGGAQGVGRGLGRSVVSTQGQLETHTTVLGCQAPYYTSLKDCWFGERQSSKKAT